MGGDERAVAFLVKVASGSEGVADNGEKAESARLRVVSALEREMVGAHDAEAMVPAFS